MTALPLSDYPSAPSKPLAVLQSVFGYDRFRGPQAEIVTHVVAGGDALVLMPTGGGKSLCYQIPALVRDGCGIVVSPLIALIQDQVAALTEAGVAAAGLHSGQEPGEQREILRALADGRLDLLYIAPERIQTPSFLEAADHARLALFAIDEAHCVSQWGHDFRPDYRALTLLHERWPWVPRIALTATADPPTRDDIIRQLKLEAARQFVMSFDRPNITYRVIAKKDPRRQLLGFIKDEHAGDAGIIYCSTRKRVDETAAWLKDQGIPALPYHAGLDAGVREAHQTRFLREEGIVMVATIAFGMGIDKPNVRFVAHLDLPKSIEAYYQETGRAGRDGLPATAWMVYGLQDVAMHRQRLEASTAPDDHKRREKAKLDAMLAYCETAECRRTFLLRQLGEALPEPCGNCDICHEPVETWEATEAARKAMSAIYRTGQRFGAEHLIAVLRGERTDKVAEHGHDRLKTFGVGTDLSKDAWRSVFRQLLALGLITADPEAFGGLCLTDAARPVLVDAEPLHLRRDPAPRAERRAAPTGRRTVELTALEERLFQAFRAWRMDLARDHKVPPYVILTDATLIDIVRTRPRGLEALSRIPGIGRSKLDRYGDAILDQLRHFG
ncbi:DNA helicase RecQ [Elstera cyanobacteriorum]|uniref:DNA helicase RecQ n=1 Tax=Elstera cyanobacteriorum TaxID=2022747 RepID=UPI002353D973|nr:DNA helicase RecQ [Elstera cyanobacteriorum]MCK6441090.1 DNA helicase RecQ [Elstera cyanobacteriorum]